MSRRNRSKKRIPNPDPIYNSTKLSMVMNKILLDGKKGVAEKIVYDALNIIKEKTKEDPIKVFEESLENIRPIMEVKSRRVGGSTYQVPMEVRPERSMALAIRWLVGYSRDKKGKSMADKISSEILDAYNKTGASVKKREDTHKMAEANKAFAHFRW